MENKKFKLVHDKRKYLEENAPMAWPEDKDGNVFCLHCNEKYQVLDYKVELMVLNPPSTRIIKQFKRSFAGHGGKWVKQKQKDI